MKKQVTFYMDSKDYELFCSRYPNVASIFFRRCVYASLADKNLFQKIFFETSEKPLRERNSND